MSTGAYGRYYARRGLAEAGRVGDYELDDRAEEDPLAEVDGPEALRDAADAEDRRAADLLRPEFSVRRGPRRDTPRQQSGAAELGVAQAPDPGAPTTTTAAASVVRNAAGNPNGPTTVVAQAYYGAKVGGLTSNFKLVLDIETTFGRATQRFTVDLPLGQAFSVGAAESVNVSARLVSPNGNALVNDVPVRVEACVLRGGSTTSKPVYVTDPIYASPGPATSTKRAIPERAVHAFVLLDDPTQSGNVDLLFFGSADAGATLLYAMSAPTNGKIPVVAGARAYAILTRAAGFNVAPTFEVSA